jgi:hypothetical protein
MALSGPAGVAFNLRSYVYMPRSLWLNSRRPSVSPVFRGRYSKLNKFCNYRTILHFLLKKIKIMLSSEIVSTERRNMLKYIA